MKFILSFSFLLWPNLFVSYYVSTRYDHFLGNLLVVLEKCISIIANSEILIYLMLFLTTGFFWSSLPLEPWRMKYQGELSCKRTVSISSSSKRQRSRARWPFVGEFTWCIVTESKPRLKLTISKYCSTFPYVCSVYEGLCFCDISQHWVMTLTYISLMRQRWQGRHRLQA